MKVLSLVFSKMKNKTEGVLDILSYFLYNFLKFKMVFIFECRVWI